MESRFGHMFDLIQDLAAQNNGIIFSTRPGTMRAMLPLEDECELGVDDETADTYILTSALTSH